MTRIIWLLIALLWIAATIVYLHKKDDFPFPDGGKYMPNKLEEY